MVGKLLGSSGAVALGAAGCVLLSGCGYKVYLRGIVEPGSAEVRPETALHVQVDPASDLAERDRSIAAKIEALLAERGFAVVSEEEDAVAYLFFDYHVRDLVSRKYLAPSPGMASGIATRASEGPFVHSLSISVVSARAYRERDADRPGVDVLWEGGAVLDTTNLRSPKTIDLMLVALFDRFPEDTGQTISIRMSLEDPRTKRLRAGAS